MTLRNAVVAADDLELQQCLALWESLKGQERWGSEWSLLALAAVQRSQLSLAAFMDTMYSQVSTCGGNRLLNLGRSAVRSPFLWRTR